MDPKERPGGAGSNAWFSMTRYVKDLERLGRPMDRVLIVDNSPYVCIHPDNAIVVDDFMGASDWAEGARVWGTAASYP